MKLCDQVFSLYLAQVYRARATSQHEVEIADADEAKDLFQVTCFEIEPFPFASRASRHFQRRR